MQAPEQLGRPFTDPAWLYELKHDGYRCMAGIEDGRARLQTKSGADCTAWFPEIARALASLPGGPHIIDGEACVLDDQGVSDFNRLQERARKRKWYQSAPQVTLCAFDLLVMDGHNLMGLPLVDRKAMLEQLLSGVPKAAVLFVGDLPADAALFKAMVDAGLKIEGVMAKRRDSTYQPGVRSPAWRKIKRTGWQEGRKWKG